MNAKKMVRIHPSADVSDKAIIGDGTSIWHQAQIREGARLGNHCIVGKGAYIDFDVSIGDNCKIQNGANIYHPAQLADGVFVGPGVIIANDKIPRAVNPDMTQKSADDWQVAGVTVEKGASLGTGSVLLPGVHIGEWAMIGAGAVVTKDVPPYGLVIGVPARLVGYVCPCGNKLEAGPGLMLKCPACHREFAFNS